MPHTRASARFLLRELLLLLLSLLVLRANALALLVRARAHGPALVPAHLVVEPRELTFELLPLGARGVELGRGRWCRQRARQGQPRPLHQYDSGPEADRRDGETGDAQRAPEPVVAGDDDPVSACVEADAQPIVRPGDQRQGRLAAHGRQVVNAQVAARAVARAIVARHAAPRLRAG